MTASQLLLRIGLKLGLETIPEAVEERILAGTDIELERWTKRALTARAIEDIFD